MRVGDLDLVSWTDLQAAERKLIGTRLFLEDSASSYAQICAAARRWRARNSDVPGLLVVDFAQLIRSERAKGQSRAEEVGLFASGFKSLAKELRVPTILVSQLNRAGSKAERPTKSDLKESSGLEQSSDLIILIWNKERTGDDDVLLLVDKFRHGQCLEVPARWIGRHFRFANPIRLAESP